MIPVVVTFHDINRYTARHMQEYLQILMDSARVNGLKTAAEPFYTDTAQVERAAIARTVKMWTTQCICLGFGIWCGTQTLINLVATTDNICCRPRPPAVGNLNSSTTTQGQHTMR